MFDLEIVSKTCNMIYAWLLLNYVLTMRIRKCSSNFFRLLLRLFLSYICYIFLQLQQQQHVKAELKLYASYYIRNEKERRLWIYTYMKLYIDLSIYSVVVEWWRKIIVGQKSILLVLLDTNFLGSNVSYQFPPTTLDL